MGVILNEGTDNTVRGDVRLWILGKNISLVIAERAQRVELYHSL
jgi:hypothetical protein